MKKLGLIINPIAGMGGKVGLKGTDGIEILCEARLRGATPESPLRAVEALRCLEGLRGHIQLITGQSVMGENEARRCGFEPIAVGKIAGKETTAGDTAEAAERMLGLDVDLLLFAGGDGTARDIFKAVGDRIPSLGIPTGVKMHSAVFAASPRKAGCLAALYLSGKTVGLRQAEVMDLDEEAFRRGWVSARLYGYLRIPFVQNLVQGLKAGSGVDESGALKEIACDVISRMKKDWIYIIGPGTTTKAITDKLNLPGTLLGVDVILNHRLEGKDVNERQLLEMIDGRSAEIIVTVIGGQGYLFGRGNQQISHRVITKVGKEHIRVIATQHKIFSLKGNTLLTDTGSEEVNRELEGFMRVTTGCSQSLMCRVSS